jgi:two-component system, OmpR family, phosphate regulon sensor histidine kinase PhoR
MTPGASEWAGIALSAVFVIVVGAATDAWGGALAAVLAVWLIAMTRNLVLLQRWARHPLQRPDVARAVWQQLAERLFRSLRNGRMRTHRVLRQLRYLRSATEALPDGAVLIKRNGEIEIYNVAAQSLLGLNRSDVGQNLVSLVRNPALTALIDGKIPDGLIEIASATSERRLEIRRIDVDPSRILILARDVTELNRLLTMRQDFIANVSHELRTPLTVMRGYLESFDDPDLDRQQLVDLAGRLRSPAERMRVLVDDLLLLTRLESNPKPRFDDMTPVAVAALLEKLAIEARELATSQHHIRVEADADLMIYGVESELHSAFANLIENAVRYSPEGGDISIRWFASADGPRFEVTDQGVGVPPEHMHRLTERFYRVDLASARVRGATGLGLAIVKHVLKRHDASLGIDSQLGKGSRFYCVFRNASVALPGAVNEQAR